MTDVASSCRWGILGAASIARKNVRAMHLADNATPLAIASRTFEKAAAFAAEHGLDRAHGSYEALLEDPDVDAVYVPLPTTLHREWTIRAAEAGKHVLCEKPFLWEPEARWSETAADLEARFDADQRILAVNTQWPWSLDAHAAATGPRAETVGSLAMGLSPASRGLQMIGDALPHPLSLAQALRPDLERLVSVEVRAEAEQDMVIEALLEGADGPMRMQVLLCGTDSPGPREAWYSVDGRRADRVIDPADYSLSLRAGEVLVPMPDPLTARIASFVDQVRRGRPCPWTRPGDLARRASMLEAAAAACRAAHP